MKEQKRCVRVWTLGKIWEDLSLEVTAGGLSGEGNCEDRNPKHFGKNYEKDLLYNVFTTPDHQVTFKASPNKQGCWSGVVVSALASINEIIYAGRRYKRVCNKQRRLWCWWQLH